MEENFLWELKKDTKRKRDLHAGVPTGPTPDLDTSPEIPL